MSRSSVSSSTSTIVVQSPPGEILPLTSPIADSLEPPPRPVEPKSTRLLEGLLNPPSSEVHILRDRSNAMPSSMEDIADARKAAVMRKREAEVFPMHFERALDAAAARHISLEELLGRCSDGTVIVVPPLPSDPFTRYMVLRRVGDTVSREPLTLAPGESLAHALENTPWGLAELRIPVFQESCLAHDPRLWTHEQQNEYDNALKAWTERGTEDVSRRVEGACIVTSTKGKWSCTAMAGRKEVSGIPDVRSYDLKLLAGETLSDAMRRLNPRFFPVRPAALAIEMHHLQFAFEDSSEVLGKGSFGEVRLCDIAGKSYAVKVVYPTARAIEEAKEAGESSLSAMAVGKAMRALVPESFDAQKMDGIPGMDHVAGFQIVNAEHIATMDPTLMPKVYMAMPLAENGSLKRVWRLTPAQAAAHGQQLFGKLAMMHGRGVAHRDIKPDNLGLDASGKVCVLDMGLSRDFGKDGREIIGIAGSKPYLSAWSFAHGPRDSSLLPYEDVFAAAITMGEIAHCDAPHVNGSYGGYHDPARAFAYARGLKNTEGKLDLQGVAQGFLTPDRLRVFYRDTLTDGPGKFELIELLVRALHPDPRHRPSAADIERELAKIAAFA